jgi:predicted phosphate transport protein (TIGR00153 family)
MRFRFVPREKAFFGLFKRASANLVEGAELLKKMVDDYSNPQASLTAIVDAEHRGDEITHEIMRTLNTTFITPMDREDIHALASDMDDVMDYIEAAADLFILHNVETPTPAVRAQTDVLLRACRTINEAVTHLERFKDLERYWVEVNDIENEGDKMYRRAVADLFNGDHKAMDVLKWKEIYDQIEAAIDECENIGDTIESIVLKNA